MMNRCLRIQPNLLTRKSLSTLLLLFLACLAESQEKDQLFFKQLSTREGLSNASVMVTYQDTYGFIWIGTRGGLNRYDGNQVINYFNESEDTTSLSNDFIFDILQVTDNELFISTEGGLDIYHYSSDSFTRHSCQKLQGLRVHHMKMDMDSTVWVSTENGLFHLLENNIESFFHSPSDSFSIGSNYIRSIDVDGQFIYLATLGGLNIYDKQTKKFQNKHNSDHPAFSKPGEITFGLLKRKSGEVWFGSYNEEGYVYINRYNPKTDYFKQYESEENGLGIFYALLSLNETDGDLYLGMNGDGMYYFDETNEQFIAYKPDPKIGGSLNDPDVWNIASDKSGNLWVSTDGGGVNQSHPLFNRFEAFQNNPYDTTSLGVNDTQDFYEDHQFVWIANNTLGLSRWDKSKQVFHNYPFNPDNPNRSLLDLTAYAINGDDNGNIWMGSYSGGLSKLDPITGNFTHIINDVGEQGPLPSNYIREIEIRGDILWMGTSDGLGKLDLSTDEIEIIRRVPVGQTFSDVVTNIEFDSEGLGWATSTSGLFYFDPINHSIDSTHTILDTLISYDLAIDKGIVWVATDKGLAKYEKVSNSLSFLRTFDGLSHAKVIGIKQDNEGNLWCLTGNGLNWVNTSTHEIKTFDTKDGLLSNQFNMGSIYKGLNGDLYAGGLAGYNRWNPASFLPVKKKPNLIFSSYTIQQGDKTITNPLVRKSRIVLNDDDNYLSVQYFSNEIIQKSKAVFAYRLREIDESWVETSDWKIQLTNLSTGKHTLDVRAKNYDGVWGNYSTLKIEVLPPIWATNEAFIFYALIVVSLFFFRDRYLKQQRKMLEQTVADRTIEIRKQKELAEQDKETISKQNEQISKSLKERESLLKEIHHRVKNNLQIIASLLYLQSGKFEDEDFKKVLEEGQGRVRSMALIHQKLYENEDLKSIPFNEYLNELVREIRASFGNEMSKISLNIHADNVYFDVDTAVPLGLIVNELATNAFKYAFNDSSSGSFSIFLTEKSGNYVLNIKDDGKGIPEETDLRKAKSLGLRLVRMLSQQLEGDFEIKNDNGTSFELKFAA